MGDAGDPVGGLGLWFPEEGAPGFLVTPGLREPNRVPHRPWHWPERAQETLGCPWSRSLRPSQPSRLGHMPASENPPWLLLPSWPCFLPLFSSILPPPSHPFQFPPTSSSLFLSRCPPADCSPPPLPCLLMARWLAAPRLLPGELSLQPEEMLELLGVGELYT